MRAAHWFGIGLASGLLFLWCLMRVIEISAAGAEVAGGWIWGLVVFGLAGVCALAYAAWAYWGTAQSARVNPLLKTTGAYGLRAGSGQSLTGSGEAPRGAGDVPRPAAGRRLG